MYLRSLINEHCDKPTEREDELKDAFILNAKFVKELNYFEKIDIFTDIPSQANLVVRALKDAGFNNKILVVKTWENAFSKEDYSKKILRLYFYAAPVSAMMRKKPNEYTKIILKPVTGKNLLKTHICVIGPKKISGETAMNEMLDNLLNYHRNLFHAAEHQPMSLRNVWWTYNRHALLHQHNSLFESPQDYARCLLLHHEIK